MGVLRKKLELLNQRQMCCFCIKINSMRNLNINFKSKRCLYLSEILEEVNEIYSKIRKKKVKNLMVQI